MKAVVRLLTDPYLHVLIVTVFLFQYAMSDDRDSAQVVLAPQPRCESCGYPHAWNDSCWVPREAAARRVRR